MTVTFTGSNVWETQGDLKLVSRSLEFYDFSSTRIYGNQFQDSFQLLCCTLKLCCTYSKVSLLQLTAVNNTCTWLVVHFTYYMHSPYCSLWTRRNLQPLGGMAKTFFFILPATLQIVHDNYWMASWNWRTSDPWTQKYTWGPVNNPGTTYTKVSLPSHVSGPSFTCSRSSVSDLQHNDCLFTVISPESGSNLQGSVEAVSLTNASSIQPRSSPHCVAGAEYNRI